MTIKLINKNKYFMYLIEKKSNFLIQNLQLKVDK